MRADVNLSVREVGASEFGTRTEMKNLNSFKAIARAIEGERARQIELLEDGKKVIQETSNIPRSAYEYLCVGDRFRYHPQLAYPYEKYDKSKDGFIYCACCMAKNELSGDRCVKCGVPLLK